MLGIALSLVSAFALAPIQPLSNPDCAEPVDPVPSGVTVSPDNALDPAEYAFMHSSTHLQGLPATEKFAPGLFYNPTAISFFTGFSSAVVVDNPSTTSYALVSIQYYDQAGTLLGAPVSVSIAPQGHYAEGASRLLDPASTTPGFGSARITADIPIVGATLHHVVDIRGLRDPDPFEPGAACMQQLQAMQDDATQLWWGPLPYTTISSKDFFNGNSPFCWIQNPNPVPNTIRIDYSTNTGALVTGVPITLPPYGSYLDTYPFFTFINWYLAGVGADLDLEIHVLSLDRLPLVGEGVMTDFFGPGTDLIAGARWRMGSTLMTPNPGQVLVNPEFTFEAGGFIETLMGIYNAGSSSTGQLDIHYYDQAGAMIATDTILAGLAPNQSLRIGHGLASTPNYPSATTFDGWVRIVACYPTSQLVGWSMREIGANPELWSPEYQFYKVYGEVLHAENAVEPGQGFAVSDLYGSFNRKISPLVKVDPGWYWPGYTCFLNDAVSNVGPYLYRFFDASGFDATNYLPQPFPGVAWAATSFTYEDPLAIFGGVMSACVDVTTGPVKGIDAIGDPLYEWGIPGFPSEVWAAAPGGAVAAECGARLH
jgi:hypothetical protein